MSAEKRNVEWDLSNQSNSVEVITLAVLMDIREELRRANGKLGLINQQLSPLECRHFKAIPCVLRAIRANTNSKKKEQKP